VVFVDERVERGANGKIDVVRKAQQRKKRKPENKPPFFLVPAFDSHHGKGDEENHGTGDDKPRQVIHDRRNKYPAHPQTPVFALFFYRPA